MTTFNIDFSDPLTGTFSIPPGGFNGPGGSLASTSLRLYGRGALEWGEAVDEDLVRLLETFAGSTPPQYPINGQLWYECVLYYYNTFNGSWHVYRYDTTSQTYGWDYLNGSLSGSQIGTSPTAPTNPSVGTYWFDGTVLRRWDSAYKQSAATWLPRSFTTGSIATSPYHPSFAPQNKLHVYDAHTGSGAWVAPNVVFASDIAPANPQVGTLWYDSTNSVLKFYDGTGSPWRAVLGTSTSSHPAATSSDIDLQNTYRIINMPTPATSTDGVNKAYVDGQLAGGLSLYVPLTGGTMTGPLVLEDTTNSNLARLIFQGTVANHRGFVDYHSSNYIMYFRTNEVERMRIDASGNVVVGNTGTSSGHRLQVQGLGATSYDCVNITNSTSGGNLFLGLKVNGVASIFSQGGGNTLEVGAQGQVVFTSGNTAGSASERMRITSAGNVLIGTTTDLGQPLQVNGYITASTPASGDASSKVATTSFVSTAITNATNASVAYYPTGSALPNYDRGPIFHADYNAWMTWQIFNANGANYIGYASVNVGRFVLEGQSVARKGTVKVGSSSLSKTTYVQLWNWALHNGLVVALGSWAQGTWAFADNGNGTFRIPDLRGESIRLLDDGRGVDSGRSLLSWQPGQMPSHTHWSDNSCTGSDARGYDTLFMSCTGDFAFWGARSIGYTGGTSNSSENRMRNFVQLGTVQF